MASRRWNPSGLPRVRSRRPAARSPATSAVRAVCGFAFFRTCLCPKKPAEVRQGKGKGSVEYWAARVKPGRILFELDGVPGPLAAEAFSRAAMKLPIKTKVVARLGDTSHLGA